LCRKTHRRCCWAVMRTMLYRPTVFCTR
jgi:hypothetical protein